MTRAVTFEFDTRRSRYRVRGLAGVDTLVNVPKDIFTAEGIPFDRETKRGTFLAGQWASDEHKRRMAARRAEDRKAKDFGEVFALYLSEKPKTVVEATVTAYHLYFGHWKRFLLERYERLLCPDEMDKSVFLLYRNWRQRQTRGRWALDEQKVSGRTVWNEMMFGRQMCRFAYEYSAITGSTGVLILSLPECDMPDSTLEGMSEDQFQLVWQATYEKRSVYATNAAALSPETLRQILAGGLTTMLRKANLLGLRIEWVTSAKSWLHIPKEFMKGKGGQKRPLSIPLSKWARDVAIEAADGRSSGYLWLNPVSTATYTSIEDRLESTADDAGVPRFSLHDIRATGNSLLAKEGVSKLTRKTLMGQSTQKTGDVNDLYTKVFEAELREAVAQFDAIRDRVAKQPAKIYALRA
jgi:integrase